MTIDELNLTEDHVDRLMVSEVFNSFQGEGRNIGLPSTFLRLAYCNLACGWCDSKYTWDWSQFHPSEQVKRLTIPDVARMVQTWNTPNVVITGGEPMLQQKNLVKLIDLIVEERSLSPVGNPWFHYEIETAGTIAPGEKLESRVDLFTVSPKLENSGNPAKKRYNPIALERFAMLATWNKAVFKFVVTTEADFKEIDDIVQGFGVPAPSVYIMPEGVDMGTINARFPTLLDKVMKRNYRLTTRLHIAVFGNVRGV